MAAKVARRDFLLGVSAAAIGAALPAMPAPAAACRSLRLAQETAYLEAFVAMSQRIQAAIFYGNPDESPTQFTGFAPRWDARQS